MSYMSPLRKIEDFRDCQQHAARSVEYERERGQAKCAKKFAEIFAWEPVTASPLRKGCDGPRVEVRLHRAKSQGMAIGRRRERVDVHTRLFEQQFRLAC